MNELCEYAISEITVKKSRFICEIFPVVSAEQARTLLKAQKKTYFDAKHVVHAFVIGKNAEILGSSDDGEPSGTAGRPILDILKGSNLTNCMITVTRYFGGVLLGTGGLVKAYSDSAKEVLKNVVSRPIIEKENFSFSVGYELYDSVKKIISGFSVTDLTENFESQISLCGQIPLSDFADFAYKIKEVTNGKVCLKIE